MTNYSLEIITESEAEEAGGFRVDPDGNFDEDFTYIKGQGQDNYLCGACGNVLCENVHRGQVINIVFVCPKCGNYNVVKGT